MPNSVFLDTNGWLALLNSKDVNHELAYDIWMDIVAPGRDIILTDWIVAETGNGLARTRIRHVFARAIEHLWNSPKVEFVTINRDLITKAVEEYRRYADKSWGIVDCASFIVMRERGVTEAFTSDRDFVQAGFSAC